MERSFATEYWDIEYFITDLRFFARNPGHGAFFQS
jgi:hypothetical protein